jgi:ribosomal protein S18 acetylase RimI-like enzyme
MTNLLFQVAQPEHAGQVAKLFREGFHEDISQLFIYGCRGASEYIRMQLTSGVTPTESAYYVAANGVEIAAAAELRRRPEGLFLNYIAVDRAHRGHRVGTKLLATALSMCGDQCGAFGLDVLCANTTALNWYLRLGFKTTSVTAMVEVTASPGNRDEPVYFAEAAQADLCQQRFGFSRFSVVTREGTFPVGRLGDAWFRLTDVRAVSHSSLVAALGRVEPSRRVFAVLPDAAVPAAQVTRVLTRTQRMEIAIPDLIEALRNDH